MKKSKLSLFASALAAACFAQSAGAATINFGGMFSGTAVGGPPPSIDETFSGSGNDITFGAFTINESGHVDVDITHGTVNVPSGSVQFTFPSSGGFTADFTGGGTFSGSTATVTLDFTIVSMLLTGDTGTMTGTGTFDSQNNLLTVNYTGKINGPGPVLGFVEGPTVDVSSTPLPAALPMFLGGAGLIGLMARRRKQRRVV